MKVATQMRRFLKSIPQGHLAILIIFLEVLSAQVLIRDSKNQIFDIERKTILRGKTNHYLSLRYQHEWKKQY